MARDNMHVRPYEQSTTAFQDGGDNVVILDNGGLTVTQAVPYAL